MPSKVEEEIKKTEKENEITETKKEQEKELPEGKEITKEQEEVLEDIEEVTPEEAVKENDLSVRQELKIKVPADKKSFDNAEEFSQYVSSLFYLYHTGNINGEVFYKKLYPHFHENFINMLPSTKEEQIETFVLLQEAFINQLSKPIVSYALTDLEVRERVNEAGFYRKYELENQEVIYYQTIIQEVDGKWLLFDDSPAPPYLITPNKKFTKQEGDNNE